MPGILLAEDNPADVYLIQEALREHGVTCPIRVAPDGKDVLRLLPGGDGYTGTETFDLIILDLNLPLHDGLEILQHIRANQAAAGVPVVILTSSDSPRDRVVAGELGAACYLRKPSSLEQFLDLGAVFKNLLAAAGTLPERR